MECGVRSVECGKCGVWKVRSVESAECGKCGVWKVRSVENAECGKCGVWKMRGVENAECGKYIKEKDIKIHTCITNTRIDFLITYLLLFFLYTCSYKKCMIKQWSIAFSKNMLLSLLENTVGLYDLAMKMPWCMASTDYYNNNVTRVDFLITYLLLFFLYSYKKCMMKQWKCRDVSLLQRTCYYR